ncbi:MAG TPA: ABC transporter ATP-binding protein [Jiangellaceae bacterium]|nr:ABC transporter ATP-binding protein [Jiangellaceae bacterium]
MTTNATISGAHHIVCDNLVRIYQTEGVEVVALQGLDLTVEAGELVAIVGASGSGKSTLLNILSGNDVPTAGRATVAGYDLLEMSGSKRVSYRRDVAGFVWQQTAKGLMPFLTAAENVALPLLIGGTKRSEQARRAEELLELLEIGHCRDRRPAEMSGGEQQRCAIGVAVANEPQVLFADEPTGELDSATAEHVFGALRRTNEELGTTVVVVTHDQNVASQVDRTVAIRDGRTSSEVVRRTELTAEGHERIIAEEYAVLDRAGRVQLPREFLAALHLRDRVRLELEPDHVGLWPGQQRRPDSTNGEQP